MKFLTTLKLSAKRSMTPEGYMLVERVPLARTGSMLYGPGETPVPVGPNGTVTIERTADELFKPETIQSFAGKPLIKGHPRTADGALKFVDPTSWKDLTVGIVMNPRRGEGADDDILLGDILVTDHATIDEIKRGHPEVSAGYDADYFTVRPGLGQQRAILGNHVAIVPAARCGSRCAMGDAHHDHQEKPMNLFQRIRAAMTAKDEAAINQLLTEGEALNRTADGGNLNITLTAPSARTGDADAGTAFDDHVEAYNAHVGRNDAEHAEFHERLSALEGKTKAADEALAAAKATADAATAAAAAAAAAQPTAEALAALHKNLEAEAPPSQRASASKVADSSLLEESFVQTVAGAEILSPGIKAPTFDMKAAPAQTFDSICALRRQALESAAANQEARVAIEAAMGGKTMDLKTITCDEARSLFNAAVAIRKDRNNLSMFQGGNGGGRQRQAGAKAPQTIAELNAINAKHYAPH